MASRLVSTTPGSSSYQLSHVTMPTGSHPGVQDGSTINRPRWGNLWRALRSVRVTTLFYSSLVAVLGSLSFGYAMGFSSPALVDLEDNKGEYTSFNKTIYSDTFNVSEIACQIAVSYFIFASYIKKLFNRHSQQ